MLGPADASFPPSHPPPGLMRQQAQQRQRHDVHAQRAALQEIMLFGEWDVASRLSDHPVRSCHYHAARRALPRDACHPRQASAAPAAQTGPAVNHDGADARHDAVGSRGCRGGAADARADPRRKSDEIEEPPLAGWLNGGPGWTRELGSRPALPPSWPDDLKR